MWTQSGSRASLRTPLPATETTPHADIDVGRERVFETFGAHRTLRADLHRRGVAATLGEEQGRVTVTACGMGSPRSRSRPHVVEVDVDLHDFATMRSPSQSVAPSSVPIPAGMSVASNGISQTRRPSP